ncbi:GIMAP protein, partial [Biomphalaria glabrata]
IAMSLSKTSDLDLLLIGKTGNGKSALGNAILRRKCFQSVPSTTSVTKEIDTEVSEFEGRIIKVVDGPGVGDTRMDDPESKQLVVNAMHFAIAANPRGYHAFLLVVKFGGRFTSEDQDTIKFLKQVFGQTFVQQFCILVMTCGDNFEKEVLNTSFKDWCQGQSGVFLELVKECNNRVLLFDNRNADEEKQVKQLKELIEMVDHLRSQGRRYTDENFKRAAKERERLLLDAKRPMIQEETMSSLSLILQKLQIIQCTIEPEKRISHLDELFLKCEDILDSIIEQDKQTGIFEDLKQTVKSVIETIFSEISFSQRMIEEKQKLNDKEEEMSRLFKEQLNLMEEEYKYQLEQDRIEQDRRHQLKEEQETIIRSRLEEQETLQQRIKEIEKEETARQLEKIAQLEEKYREEKKKNEEGFFGKVVQFVSWLFN